mgnify:CR=1 FL=1
MWCVSHSHSRFGVPLRVPPVRVEARFSQPQPGSTAETTTWVSTSLVCFDSATPDAIDGTTWEEGVIGWVRSRVVLSARPPAVMVRV